MQFIYNPRYKVPWASEMYASHLIPYSVTVYTMWGWIWMNCMAWSNSHCQSMKMEVFLLKELLRIPDSEALWIFRSSVNVGVTIYSSCQSSYKGQELLCPCWTGIHNGHMSLTFQMTTFLLAVATGWWLLHECFTTFTLTRLSSDLNLGTVTKCSVNRPKPCQTELHWDLLSEPGQHGSVWLRSECKLCELFRKSSTCD